ncbi:MAG: GNAT family N-acetyltransferase [Chitinophagaceae bacterium]
MMNVIIERLDNTYSEQIGELILPIQQQEFNIPITLAEQVDLSSIEQFYDSTGGCFLGAFINNYLVGTLAIISFAGDAGAIRKMFVRKEYRGREYMIAQRLFQTLISYCIDKKITNIYLGTIDVFKAAQRFYERNGFVEINKTDLPAAFPLMSVDNVFYYRDLKNDR